MEDENITQEKVSKNEEMVERANAAAGRLEEANKRLEKNLKEQEKLQVIENLGGKAEAKDEKVEETPEEYKDKVMGGMQ